MSLNENNSIIDSDSNEYLVGYLDIIGFKYLLRSKGLQIISNSLYRILSGLKDALETGTSNIFFRNYNPISKEIPERMIVSNESKNILMSGFFNFSDTILLYSKLSENEEENKNKFFSMCWVMNRFISKSILDPRDLNFTNFALRGAISKGKGFVNNDLRIHIGEPFIRAYRLAESQNWMGGVVDKNIDENWVREIVGFNKEIIDYCIPSYQPTGYALNWPQSHPYDHKYGEFHRSGPKIEDLKNHISSYDWSEKEDKKNNTINFAEKICELWDEAFPKSNSH